MSSNDDDVPICVIHKQPMTKTKEEIVPAQNVNVQVSTYQCSTAGCRNLTTRNRAVLADPTAPRKWGRTSGG